MATRIPNQVMTFAGGQDKLTVYLAFADYWNHYRAQNEEGKENLPYKKFTLDKDGKQIDFTLEAKEAILKKGIVEEILRKSGVSDVSQFALETWSGHPVIKWASFAVVSALIDMILPQTLIDSIGMYTDVSSVGYGDTGSFNITPRDLFVVSKVGKAKRTSLLQKQFRGQVNINPEPRQVSVTVSLYRVLSGEENLADFVSKCVRSMESQVTVDVYNVFATAMSAISNTASTGLRVAGYTQAEFVRLSQTVRSWNNGAKPLAIGTQAALANILPADANYRYDIDSEFVKMGYIRNFQQTDILMLPQVADWETPFANKLSDTKIWIVSPSVNKLVKLVLEGSTRAYQSDVYQNADLTQDATLQKSWGAAIATNAVGATIEL